MAYLIAAYVITFGVIFSYVFSLSQRQQNLRREIEALKKALSRRRERQDEG